MNSEANDIYTSYAIDKDGCDVVVEKLIHFSEKLITGPNFSCKLSEVAPAVSSMTNHTAICKIDGNDVTDYVAYDLGNYKNHFEVYLPQREEWLTMYPCSDVSGLIR